MVLTTGMTTRPHSARLRRNLIAAVDRAAPGGARWSGFGGRFGPISTQELPSGAGLLFLYVFPSHTDLTRTQPEASPPLLLT
jgi:hypothetical protein